MGDENWPEAYRKHQAEESAKQLEEHRVDISSFKNHWCNLGHNSDELQFEYVQTIGIVAKCPNIISRLTPDLVQDKEGLVNCRNLYSLYEKNPLTPGYLYSPNHIAMLNPIFRRGFGEESNWAPQFVDMFWEVNDENIDAYISLDFDRVRVDMNGMCYFEKDAWFGPPFKEDISSIQDGACKVRPPLDIDSSLVSVLFADAYSLDVYWDTKEGVKSFQALEFKNDMIKLEIEGEECFPARYIHAEFDLEGGYFRHFDGAVQWFSADEYYLRRDTDFRHYRKAKTHIKAKSKKAFKFNGKIPTEMWKEFASHFCTKNPLFYEYLSSEYPRSIQETLEKIREADVRLF